MTNQVLEFPSATPSRLVAAEIRAEIARQGHAQRWLADQLQVSQAWVSRRISATSDVEITLDEIPRIAKALDVPVERLLSAWLPRLDSNQQPSGYPPAQVSAGADVVELQAFRIARAAERAS